MAHTLSPPAVPTKYASPSLRLAILHLLETEGTVTRNRLAEVLGIGRMTAHRIAEQLLIEKLLIEINGSDPITHRQSRLLALSPVPPLLLTDVCEDEPRMYAYLVEDQTVRFSSADYRFTLDVSGNKQVLWDRVKQEHRPSDTVRCFDLYRENKRDTSPLVLPVNTHTMDREAAIGRALEALSELKDSCSILHVQRSHHIRCSLFVRDGSDAPWFSPSGCQTLSERRNSIEAKGFDDIRDFLLAYFDVIHPDIILIEDAAETYFPYQCDRAILSRSTVSPVPISAFFTQTMPFSSRILHWDTPLPLWGVGTISRCREDEWLGRSF